MTTVTDSPQTAQRATEIEAITVYGGHAIRRNPAAAETITRAVDVAIYVSGLAAPVDWHRFPGSNGRTYRLQLAVHGWSCNCPAYQHRPVTVDGEPQCKHSLAATMIREANHAVVQAQIPDNYSMEDANRDIF